MKTKIFIISFLVLALAGFSQQKEKKKENEKKDSTVFQICNKKEVYSVDFKLLSLHLDEKLKKAKTNPKYLGESWRLRRWFTDHQFDYNRAKDMVFRVSIAFVVNCEGKAGNFMLLTEHEDKELNMAKELLETAKRLPFDWEPAVKKKQNVDCWFVISITVFNGEFTTIFWDY
jgi:hypothetical protein